MATNLGPKCNVRAKYLLCLALAVPILLVAGAQLGNLFSAAAARAEAAAPKPKQHRDESDAPCLEAPMTVAVGIGGGDCAARLASVERLRTMLYSLDDDWNETTITRNNNSDGNNARLRAQPNSTPTPTIHILLWLNSEDNTTLPLVEDITSNLQYVADVTAIDIGNSTALTQEISPPVTTAFIYRRYDWFKFWGIHHPNNPRRYVLNVDVDAIFLRPLSQVWSDGCRKLLGGPLKAFYVAGSESLGTASDHPGFSRYVNSGVAFLDLHRREAAYNTTILRNVLVPEVHKDRNLTAEGTWPPEQWLWNALFHHRPWYLALFDNSTQCNCATHDTFPGAGKCKLAHYCNTEATSLFNETSRLRFSTSLANYIESSRTRLYRRLKSASRLACPNHL